MCLGGVDRKPPPSDCDPRGCHIRGFQPLASLGVRNPASQILFITQQTHRHQNGVAGFGSPPSRQGENETGGRRVSGDCIKDGLSKSTCKLPYSFGSGAVPSSSSRRRIGLLTQWLSTIFAETMALNSFAMVNLPTPGKPMSTMRTPIFRDTYIVFVDNHVARRHGRKCVFQSDRRSTAQQLRFTEAALPVRRTACCMDGHLKNGDPCRIAKNHNLCSDFSEYARI